MSEREKMWFCLPVLFVCWVMLAAYDFHATSELLHAGWSKLSLFSAGEGLAGLVAAGLLLRLGFAARQRKDTAMLFLVVSMGGSTLLRLGNHEPGLVIAQALFLTSCIMAASLVAVARLGRPQ